METHPQIGKSIQNQTTMIDEPLRGEAGAPEEGCVEYSNEKQGANTAERWRRDGAIDDIDTAALKRSMTSGDSGSAEDETDRRIVAWRLPFFLLSFCMGLRFDVL